MDASCAVASMPHLAETVTASPSRSAASSTGVPGGQRLQRLVPGGLPPGDPQRVHHPGPDVALPSATELEQSRAVATRYDKRDYMYQATIDVASIRIWLRDPVPLIYGTRLSSRACATVGVGDPRRPRDTRMSPRGQRFPAGRGQGRPGP
jgi:hypothetical protein